MKRTEAELERINTLDTVRTLVTLKLRQKRREILNELEDELMEQFDKRLRSSKPYRLDVRSIIEEVDNSL